MIKDKIDLPSLLWSSDTPNTIGDILKRLSEIDEITDKVMKEKFNEVWNGEKWEEVKELVADDN